MRRRPAVAALVAPHPDAAATEIDEIGGSRAVDVDEPDAPLVERLRPIEQGAGRHGHLRAESTVAQVRPVAHATVVHLDEIRQAVPGHVGDADGVPGPRERGRRPVVGRIGLGDPARGPETLALDGRVPAHAVAAFEEVRIAVAGQIDEPERDLSERGAGEGSERTERTPAIRRPLAESGSARPDVDEAGSLRAGEDEHRLAGSAVVGRRWPLRHLAGGPEPRPAEVPLVEPGAVFLAQQTGKSLAVEVQPMLLSPRSRRGKPGERPVVDGRDDAAEQDRGIAERQRRKGIALVRGAVPDVPRELRRHKPRARRIVLVAEVQGAHEAGLRSELREVVEHEDPPAAPVGPHLEAGTVRRERVAPCRPRPVRFDRRRRLVVVAIVEDDREQPAVARLGNAVAVADPLQVAGRTARGPMCLRDRGRNADKVFGLVLVDDDIALVVEALVEQPAEDATLVGGVGDPGSGRGAVQRGHVAGRDDPPVDVAAGVRPAFDAGERALRPGPVAADVMWPLVPLVADPAVVRIDQGGDQFVLAGEHEGVAVGRVVVGRQATVRSPDDRRGGERPAEPEDPVARPRVVHERARGRETRPPARDRHGDREARHPERGVGRERLTDAADGVAALPERS